MLSRATPELQCNLQWKTFGNYLKNFCYDLGSSKINSDVTLVCDDNVKIKAHKFILSHCSPMLKELFLKNDLTSVIFLDGVNHEDLELLLDFVYFGEIFVKKNDLGRVLNLAKNLEVTGIKKMFDPVQPAKKIEVSGKPAHEEVNDNADDSTRDNEQHKKTMEKYNCLLCEFSTSSYKDIEIHVEKNHRNEKEYISNNAENKNKSSKYRSIGAGTVVVNRQVVNQNEKKSRNCHQTKLCDNVPSHQEEECSLIAKIRCSLCPHHVFTNLKLFQHLEQVHHISNNRMYGMNVKSKPDQRRQEEACMQVEEEYPCIFCDSSFNSSINLKQHMTSVHSPGSDYKI